MGSFCSSGQQTTTTNQTQTYTPDPRISQYAGSALKKAGQAANQPFQMPAAPVAGFTPFQDQAYSQIMGLQGSTAPYFANAAQGIGEAGEPVTQEDTASYLNPYAEATLANLKKYVFDPQRVATMGNEVRSAGGVGAERLALSSQNLDKTQGDALSQAMSGFYLPAMQQAQRAKEMALQSGQGWANLGMNRLGAGLQETGALATAGAQQQSQKQRELMSPYQQTLARIAYPFQTSQFLAGIAGGLAPALGGTTTGQGTSVTQLPQPSPFNQIVGLGAAGVGAYGAFGGFDGGGGGAGAPGMGGYGGAQVGYDPSGNYYNYSADGGVVGYDEGGAVGEEAMPPLFPSVATPNTPELASMIPHFPLKMGSGQNTGAKLNLNPPPQQKSGGSGGGLGDAAKIASMAMMFLNRGGQVSTGGSVNPWDIGRGYDDGGSVFDWGTEVELPFQDRFSAADNLPEAMPAPRTISPFDNRFDPVGDIPQPQTDYSAPLKTRGEQLAAPQATAPILAEPGTLPARVFPTPPGPAPDAPLTPTPVRTTSFRRPEPQESPQAPVYPKPVANTDMSPDNFYAPRERKPYPDATQRDWGQKLTRSPWLSLMTAGAKMAQTVGPPGAAIGAGIQAGVGHLSEQRKELRNEEQINQKADDLYRHAVQELNKYTRMTPYESARLEQERYQWQPGTGPDPETGQMTTGAWRLPTRSGEAPTFVPGAKITGRGAGSAPTAMQKNIEYLVANGLAPSKEVAYEMVSQSVNNRAIYGRLVQAQEKILMGHPAMAGKEPAEIHAEAERIVREMQKHVTPLRTPPAEGANPEPTPTPSGETPVGNIKPSKSGHYKKIKAGPDTDPANWQKIE